MALFSWTLVGLNHPGERACHLAQFSSHLCALTGRGEGEQVCLWYDGRFLNLAFVQSLCYCFLATRSCGAGDSRQRWL